MQCSTIVVMCMVLIIVFTDIGKHFSRNEASYLLSVRVDSNI
jgi:hypothetical protein